MNKYIYIWSRCPWRMAVISATQGSRGSWVLQSVSRGCSEINKLSLKRTSLSIAWLSQGELPAFYYCRILLYKGCQPCFKQMCRAWPGMLMAQDSSPLLLNCLGMVLRFVISLSIAGNVNTVILGDFNPNRACWFREAVTAIHATPENAQLHNQQCFYLQSPAWQTRETEPCRQTHLGCHSTSKTVSLSKQGFGKSFCSLLCFLNACTLHCGG